MIEAGKLKHKLEFYSIIKTTSDSGFATTSKQLLFKCKSQKLKSSGTLNYQSKELFHTNEIQFKVRYNKLLNDKLIVKFENIEYKITFIDYNQNDNSAIIFLEKINK